MFKEQATEEEIFLEIERYAPVYRELMSLLVEECDSEGCVRLPRLYASYFQTKDATGGTIEDDLARFCRHVIPVGNGRYRLSRETKEPLVRE